MNTDKGTDFLRKSFASVLLSSSIASVSITRTRTRTIGFRRLPCQVHPWFKWNFQDGIHQNKAVKGTNNSQKASSDQALAINATNQHSPIVGGARCVGDGTRRHI